MKRWTLTAVCTAAVLSLAACGTTNTQSNHPDSRSGHTTPAKPHVMNTSTNETLQAYHWYLDKAEDAQGKAISQLKALEPKTHVRLDFLAGSKPGEQTVFTKVCNNMMAGYTLEGDKIQVGRAMSTLMGCQDARLMQIERMVGEQMGRMESVKIVQAGPEPRMVLRFNDGSRWHMSGQPTDATRYGGPGETVFMEVAAHTKPCGSGVQRTECLQVREVRYDSAGLKTSVGEWQNFYGSIDGFEFQPGVRHVLRLKRYTVKNPPADGSSVAYVLDMRVETELVDRK